MELKIDSSRVRQAAKSCAQAKEILKVLFPEAFREDISSAVSIFLKEIEKTSVNEIYIQNLEGAFRPLSGICIRSGSNYKKQGIWLANTLNMTLVKDDAHEDVLVPSELVVPNRKIIK